MASMPDPKRPRDAAQLFLGNLRRTLETHSEPVRIEKGQRFFNNTLKGYGIEGGTRRVAGFVREASLLCGNELVFETQALLKKVPLNYIGNVEGRDIVNGNCDVTVCDGFVGNVTIKAIEGVGELVYELLKKEMKSNLFTLMGGLLASPAFRRFKRSIDYKEYGGAPLLGIDGISIISHGKSNGVALKNAVRATLRCVKGDMNGLLREQIEKYGQVADKIDVKRETT